MLRICFLFFLLLGCDFLLAQSAERQQAIDNVALDYLRTIGSQSTLYYGNVPEGHPRALNHPFLKDVQFAKARLSYRQVIYPEELLRLDLSRDELVIQTSDFRNIILIPENIDFAELHGRNIIYFRQDSLSGSPSSGYYFLLHSATNKVLVKQTANIMLDNNRQYFYSFSTKYYLYHNDAYYVIRNQSGLLKALKPYKKELKRFISANKLFFRHDAEKFLSLTIGEYEKISSSLSKSLHTYQLFWRIFAFRLLRSSA